MWGGSLLQIHSFTGPLSATVQRMDSTRDKRLEAKLALAFALSVFRVAVGCLE